MCLLVRLLLWLWLLLRMKVGRVALEVTAGMGVARRSSTKAKHKVRSPGYKKNSKKPAPAPPTTWELVVICGRYKS